MARPKKAVKSVDPALTQGDFYTRLQKWSQLSNQLAQIKAEEFALRQALVIEAFDKAKMEGTETIELAAGWCLSAVKVQSYTLSNEQGETTKLLYAINETHPEIAAGLVRWSPDMSKTSYNALLKVIDSIPAAKEALALALTVKPGMPSLELIPPKVETPV